MNCSKHIFPVYAMTGWLTELVISQRNLEIELGLVTEWGSCTLLVACEYMNVLTWVSVSLPDFAVQFYGPIQNI